MKSYELKIDGMSCSHCVMALKKELSKIDGVTIDAVAVGSARIVVDEAAVSQERIKKAVSEAGYVLTAIN
ncbi:MAG TPA: heavy-metal-associated domain-containing protein [Bacteroidota bacterium]|nr:heavy-metal-associated domain-containing protein [Bacteroidota bacterium]